MMWGALRKRPWATCDEVANQFDAACEMNAGLVMPDHAGEHVLDPASGALKHGERAGGRIEVDFDDEGSALWCGCHAGSVAVRGSRGEVQPLSAGGSDVVAQAFVVVAIVVVVTQALVVVAIVVV